MNELNPIFAIDFYKVDHRRQYPEGTTEIYSNFTPRWIKKSPSNASDNISKVVVFGIQGFIKEFLIEQWNKNFFGKPVNEVITEYKNVIEKSLGVADFDCSHIEHLHDLGYLPIRIRAIPEGMRVPIGIPVLSIVNTEPEFFWLTNYLETAISASIWKAMTSATTAFEFKKLLMAYAKETCETCEFVPYQAHDFSFRGMSGIDDAIMSGSGHLTSFLGTDCVPAISYLMKNYDIDPAVELIGTSVPATEHSVMCCNGKQGELETVRRLITEIYPEGIVSIVLDSYNLWTAVSEYLLSLRDLILARNGKVVVRPDSGYPEDIICGDSDAPEDSPAHKGVLQILWEIFGGTLNSKGYKVLDPHIGLIYGDAITLSRASSILSTILKQGFASSNIVFGVGSFTYQYVTRDTLGWAMKATSCIVNGERRAIFKNPEITDSNKRSAKGLLQVQRHFESGNFILNENVTEIEERNSFLETVFEDGELIRKTDFNKIRLNLEEELRKLE